MSEVVMPWKKWEVWTREALVDSISEREDSHALCKSQWLAEV